MKKLTISLVATALALSIVTAGCGSAGSQGTTQPQEATPQEETVAQDQTEDQTATQEEAKPMLGGWTMNSEYTPAYDPDAAAVFNLAYEELCSKTDRTYECVATLGTQVVSGTNYAFLCRGINDLSNADLDEWYVVVVYHNLDGAALPTSVQKIDLADIKTSEEGTPAGLMGGWKVLEPANAALLPEAAGVAFNKAAEQYMGAALHPMVTLGTQLVSGTNYLVLCEGQSPEGNPANSLYVATLYVDLEGNAELTNVQFFDLLSYLGNAE